MPTKNRHRFIPRAIRCFLAQTHEPKELLILDDGESVEDLVPDDPRIRYVRCERASTLAAKRNFACELARGEYVAHWDDDDWSHPGRLAAQLAVAPVCCTIQRMMFWDETRNATYSFEANDNQSTLGTSLVYRKDWWQAHPFDPRRDIAEDVAFARTARRAGKLTVLDIPGLMVATTHSRGTSPRNMKIRHWQPAEKSAIPEDYWVL